MTNYTFVNGVEVKVVVGSKGETASGIYPQKNRNPEKDFEKLFGVKIDPEALTNGNLVGPLWIEGDLKKSPKIVLAKDHAAPMVRMKFMLLRNRSEYVRLEASTSGRAFRVGKLVTSHQNKGAEKDHTLEGLFILPKGSSVDVWHVDDKGNDVARVALAENHNGEITVTMFVSPLPASPVMQALKEVAAQIAK